MEFFGLSIWAVAAISLGLLLFLALLILMVYSSMYQKAGPNEVLIISGRNHRQMVAGHEEHVGFRLVKGGGTIVWPIIEKVDRMSLEVITLDLKTPEFYTKQGVPVVVEGVAQIKVKGDDVSIRTASEQFLSKDTEEIQSIAFQTMAGHLRGILGALSVEDILGGHEAFAQRVAEVSASDLANMGLTVISFTIREIHDGRGYLESLGKTRIAQVRRDAQIGEAEAKRDATIRAAEAEQEGETAKLQAQLKIAQVKRDVEIKQNEFNSQVNQKKAESDLAYDVQKNITSQTLRKEEIQVEIVGREQQTILQEREVLRRRLELEATVAKQVDAERYRLQTLAEAEKYRLEAEAQGRAEAERKRGLAEADVIRATGEAEADIIRQKGLAEAEVMRIKADAWKQYGQAALAQMFVEKLPELARAVSEPLSKTDKIVIVNSGNSPNAGASKITADVAQIIAQLPPMIEAITGLSLESLLGQIKEGALAQPQTDSGSAST